MKIHTLLVALLLPVLLLSQQPVKREFRGAWIHTVGNQQFKTMSTDSIKAMLIKTLDILEEAGVNAVIFQVRPQA
ncbi:MAG: hypothetical protein AB7D08_05360, partial [Bacteroidales bacterium]